MAKTIGSAVDVACVVSKIAERFDLDLPAKSVDNRNVDKHGGKCAKKCGCSKLILLRICLYGS